MDPTRKDHSGTLCEGGIPPQRDKVLPNTEIIPRGRHVGIGMKCLHSSNLNVAILFYMYLVLVYYSHFNYNYVVLVCFTYLPCLGPVKIILLDMCRYYLRDFILISITETS